MAEVCNIPHICIILHILPNKCLVIHLKYFHVLHFLKLHSLPLRVPEIIIISSLRCCEPFGFHQKQIRAAAPPSYVKSIIDNLQCTLSLTSDYWRQGWYNPTVMKGCDQRQKSILNK